MGNHARKIKMKINKYIALCVSWMMLERWYGE